MSNKIKEFLEKVIELGNGKFCEIRIFDMTEKYKPFSKYIKNYEEYLKIIDEFKSERWNLYYGINVREKQSRKMSDIKVRKIFYFDIENTNDKPSYEDIENFEELKNYCSEIIHLLKNKYSISPCSILTTGRGLSVYYKFTDIHVDLENKFKNYIRSIFDFIKEQNISEKFKCWDSVIDSSRINGLPGTINHKYTEKPLREVIWLKEDNINDIISEIEKFKVKKYKKKDIKVSNKDKKSFDIYETAEWKLIEDYVLPEGDIHRQLLLALKLLLKKYEIYDYSEIEERLKELDYTEDMSWEDLDDYQYTTSLYNNWCLNNYDFCLENDIDLPYEIVKRKYKIIKNFDCQIDILNFVDKNKKISDFFVLKKTIIELNNLLSQNIDGIRYYDYRKLEEVLKIICKDKLFEFIKHYDLMIDLSNL